MSAILEAESISKRYPTRSGELSIIEDVSLALDAGDSAAIMGPSGAGKSTLLNIIAGLEPPSGGTIRLGGVDPFSLSERELARFRNHSVGFIFQEHHLLPQCSVLENVLVPTLADADGPDRMDRALQLLDRVGLADRLEHRPAELSGGERQRVAIARALINEPLLLVADEPTGNLDGRTAGAIADLLLEVHRDRVGGAEGVLVVVTHSEALAGRFDRRWQLADGTLTHKE